MEFIPAQPIQSESSLVQGCCRKKKLGGGGGGGKLGVFKKRGGAAAGILEDNVYFKGGEIDTREGECPPLIHPCLWLSPLDVVAYTVFC